MVLRVAEILVVIKQTVYYWIKKGWTAEPGMDDKNQRIFTKVELNRIIKLINSVVKSSKKDR